MRNIRCRNSGRSSARWAEDHSTTVFNLFFALAATFLHAITGAAPRSGPSFAALLAIAAERPLLDDHPRLTAPGTTHAALARCLAHEPNERPRSARDALALFR